MLSPTRAPKIPAKMFAKEANKFVDVELVIVPFVALMFEPDNTAPEMEPVIARLVTVALVSVAFVAEAFWEMLFTTVRLPMVELVTEALVRERLLAYRLDAVALVMVEKPITADDELSVWTDDEAICISPA